MATQLLAGFLFTNAGVPIASATVDLLTRNTTTPVLATTTTDANGYWAFSYATEGRYDVRITNGSSVRWHMYDASAQFTALEVQTLRVRNPALTFDYDIVPGAIVADRQLNLPLITATRTLVANNTALADNESLIFGTGADASILYDGTNLVVNPILVGAGVLDLAAGILELNNAVRFDTGVAMVAAAYAIGRDADATNQLHANVPTGATFEWSVNDVAEMTLSATAMALGTNTLTAAALLANSNDSGAIGASGTAFSDLFLASGAVIDFAAGDVTLTHAAGKLTYGGDGAVELDFNNHEMTNVDVNSGAIDGVIIGAASAAAATVTTLAHSGLRSASVGLADRITDTTADAQSDVLVGAKASLVDNTATGFLRFSIANAYTGAVVQIWYRVDSNWNSPVKTGMLHVTIGRNTGRDTVAAVAESVAQQSVSPAASDETLTVTFAMSAVTGASGAAQTIDLNITSDVAATRVSKIAYRATIVTGGLQSGTANSYITMAAL